MKRKRPMTYEDFKECYAYTINIILYKSIGRIAEYNIRFYSDSEVNKESTRMYKKLNQLIKKDKSITNVEEKILYEILEDRSE